MAEIIAPAAKTGEGKHKKLIGGLFLLFIVVGLVGGGWWWYESSKYVSTDDARVDGTIVNVGAKISGRVLELLVKEGDVVKAGQLVAKLDPRDMAAQRAQAEAAMAAAKAQYDAAVAGSRPQEIGQNEAGVAQASAMMDQARVSMESAERNYERMRTLYRQGAISYSQMDSAETAYHSAQESWNAMNNAKDAAQAKLDLSVAGSREETIRAAAAAVKQAEAALQAAKLMEENTGIVSPVDGIVALKSVNSGEVVSAGQSLFSVVSTGDLWVNARIEETKIGRVKNGETVEYTVDGYPGVTFSGKVYDVGMAAASVFALIPTENSSGNFTKVTQRIPVKITLPQDKNATFRPGMSVVVKIHLE